MPKYLYLDSDLFHSASLGLSLSLALSLFLALLAGVFLLHKQTINKLKSVILVTPTIIPTILQLSIDLLPSLLVSLFSLFAHSILLHTSLFDYGNLGDPTVFLC